MKNLLIICFLILQNLFPIDPVSSYQKEASDRDPFEVMYDEGPVLVKAGESYLWTVQFAMPEGYYLYDTSLDIEVKILQWAQADKVIKSESQKKDDPFLGEVVDVHYNRAELQLPLTFNEKAAGQEIVLEGNISYQGCSSNLCYKFNKLPFQVTFKVADAGSTSSESLPQKEVKSDEPKTLFQKINDINFDEIGFLWAVLFSFIGGVLTDLTPCVWPLIPVILAVVGVRKDASRIKNAIALLVMILGMSLMYAALGLFAALAGKGLGFIFQQTAFLALMTLVLFVMSFSLLGLFQIRLPHKAQQFLAQISATGYRGIFFTGMTLGLMAAPCVGPVVGPLLVYVAKNNNISEGVLLLLAYAMGMGFPFILMGLFYSDLKNKLKSGPWMVWMERFLGILLMLVALQYSLTLYQSFQSKQALQDSFWLSSLAEGKQVAREQDRPLMIDFYADWCAPCHELDKKVWSHDLVKEELEKYWVAVKIDCTTETQICQEAVSELNIVGWPTIVIMDKQQKEIESARLVGKVIDHTEMLKILKSVRE